MNSNQQIDDSFRSQQSEKGIFLTGLANQSAVQEKEYLQKLIKNSTQKNQIQNLSEEKRLESPFSQQEDDQQQTENINQSQQKQSVIAQAYDEDPEKPFGILESESFEMSSKQRKFLIELESLKTAYKIATIQVEGKLEVCTKHFDISVDQIKQTLLRKIEDQYSKQQFMKMQVESLEGENQLLKIAIDRIEKRVKSMENYLGMEEDYFNEGQQQAQINYQNQQQLQYEEEKKQ